MIPKINSSHGAETRNIINRAIEVLNEQGKSIQDLVAEGQLTPAQYAQLISAVNGNVKRGNVTVHDIDINKGKFLPRHLSEEVLEMIAGDAPVNAVPANKSLTTIKYANRSVTPNVTTFAKPGKNIFDGVFYNDIRLTGSPAVGGTIITGGGGVMAFVEVEAGKSYTISKSDSDYFRIGLHNKIPEDGESIVRYAEYIDTLNSATISVEGDERYLCLYVASEVPPTELQVEEGDKATVYESPTKVRIELSDGSVPPSALQKGIEGKFLADNTIQPSKTAFATPGKNLFDGDFAHDVRLVGGPDSPETSYIAYGGGGVMAFVRAEPNTTYTVTYSQDTDRFRIATLSDEPRDMLFVSRFLVSFTPSNSFTLTTTADEKYIAVLLSSPSENKEPSEFQVEVGDVSTSYEAPGAINLLLGEETKRTLISEATVNDFGIIFAGDFGASTEKTDNKNEIQSAINAAHDKAVATGSEKVIVWLKEGVHYVDGTIYLKSYVELAGTGIIKAVPNANLDTVYFAENNETIRPYFSQALLVIGSLNNPIVKSGVKGVTVDLNGDAHTLNDTSSYIGIAISNAQDCYADDAKSYNAPYTDVQVGDARRGLCLFIANAKNTHIRGGHYRRSGYDVIRVAGFAENTHLDNVVSEQAKIGTIQVTPLSKNTFIDGCHFDNTEGGTSSSHAFFAHNGSHVYVNNTTLSSKDGYPIWLFSDGVISRHGYSDYIKMKNVSLVNDYDRFVGIVDKWTHNIEIEGTVLTTPQAEQPANASPIFLREASDISIDLDIENIKHPLVYMYGTEDVDLKFNIKTEEVISRIISTHLHNGKRCDSISLADSKFDTPNADFIVKGNGASDVFKILNTKMIAKDSVDFTADDTYVQLLDSDLRKVEAPDKIGNLNATNVVTRNIIGI